MISKSKKIIVAFVLTAFLVLVFFGVSSVMHGSDEGMNEDCLFSSAGMSLCPQNVLPMIFDHISAYRSFFNVAIPGMTVFLFFLSLVISTIIIRLTNILFKPPLLVYVGNFPPVLNESHLIRWLSLFENSPSKYFKST